MILISKEQDVTQTDQKHGEITAFVLFVQVTVIKPTFPANLGFAVRDKLISLFKQDMYFNLIN